MQSHFGLDSIVRVFVKCLIDAKRTILRIGLLVMLIAIIGVSMHKCMSWATASADYETHDLAQYGIYVGNSEEYMHEYIGRFFPDRISDAFHDVTYVFRSRAVDEYGFEAYLEFTINDPQYFAEYIHTVTDGLLSRAFYFDTQYQEFVVYDKSNGFIYDHIQLGEKYHNGKSSQQFFQIHYAKIAKILVNFDEQRVIFVALAVHDGGGSDTAFFSEFFSRFDLDPAEYAAYTSKIPNLVCDTAQENTSK